VAKADDETRRIDVRDADAHKRFVEAASGLIQTARNLAVSAASDLERIDDLLGASSGAFEEVERGIIGSVQEKLRIVREYRDFMAGRT